MTRIVAGFAGSLSLAVPPTGTRPTSDRVREAIFSALDARNAVRGARVLDLYAGSGALGLEAASRGAASVVLVDRNSVAAAVCRRNAAAVSKAAPRDEPSIRVRTSSVASFLATTTGPFDLVFLDPPYDLGENALTDALTALAPSLAPGGLVLVERSTRSPEPTWPDELIVERSKSYGETVVWTAARRAAA